MNNLTAVDQLQSALNSAQHILIAFPQKANLDKVAAGLALYLSLKKANKQVAVVCSQPMTVGFSSLIGIDKVSNKTGGRNLVISLDYFEDSIEKVSYNIEDKKFNLVVQPKKGFPPLSTKKVKYSYTGGEFDLIFAIGASSLDDLGKIFLTNKALFTEDKLVNFAIQPAKARFAKINLVDEKAASLSETMTYFLSRLKLPVDTDIATNLLSGIKTASGNFSSAKVRAATFEAAAFCLRAGAKLSMPIINKKTALSTSAPSPDWLEPKIYKGNSLV